VQRAEQTWRMVLHNNSFQNVQYGNSFKNRNPVNFPDVPSMFHSGSVVYFANRALRAQEFNLPMNSKVYDLNKTGQSKACKLFVITKHKQYVPVEGCLDSGCHTTAGSSALHMHLCKNVKPVIGNVYFLLPNGALERALNVGFMDI